MVVRLSREHAPDARRRHRCARRPDSHHVGQGPQGLDVDLLPIWTWCSGNRSIAGLMGNDEQKSLDGKTEGANLLDGMIVLAKHKRLVLGLPSVVAVASAVIALLMPNVYTGVTKILPPQQTQSTSAVLAQLG